LSDLGNQAVAHGVLLQHIDSVMQIEFADGVEVRSGLTAHPEHIERGRGSLCAGPRRHEPPPFVTVHWFAPESRDRAARTRPTWGALRWVIYENLQKHLARVDGVFFADPWEEIFRVMHVARDHGMIDDFEDDALP
jgi:hypothetical protein